MFCYLTRIEKNGERYEKDIFESCSTRGSNFIECGECVKICPVNIFDKKENRIITIEVNEDECTLCNLCLDKCPVDAIEIEKLYDK